MGRNIEKDAIEMADKKKRILEQGFKIFSERTIEKVTMSDVADAAEIGIASLYRYYNTKQDLLLAINSWIWEDFMDNVSADKLEGAQYDEMTGAEAFEDYLDIFIDLYLDHKDMLRFSQFFNVYLQSEDVPPEELKSFTHAVTAMGNRFLETWGKGMRDGTLHSDMPAREVFTVTLHLMLAAATRYAVGLAYTENTDAEKDLRLLKKMLVDQFTVKK